MIEVDCETWKRICQEVDHLDWCVGLNGDDGIREYCDGERVVARMTVIGSATDLPGNECERKFEATQEIIDQSAHHVILTEADWQKWDDLDGSDDESWLRSKGVL